MDLEICKEHGDPKKELEEIFNKYGDCDMLFCSYCFYKFVFTGAALDGVKIDFVVGGDKKSIKRFEVIPIMKLQDLKRIKIVSYTVTIDGISYFRDNQ